MKPFSPTRSFVLVDAAVKQEPSAKIEQPLKKTTAKLFLPKETADEDAGSSCSAFEVSYR